jgi:hypothetical protein
VDSPRKEREERIAMLKRLWRLVYFLLGAACMLGFILLVNLYATRNIAATLSVIAVDDGSFDIEINGGTKALLISTDDIVEYSDGYTARFDVEQITQPVTMIVGDYELAITIDVSAQADLHSN